MKLKWVTVGGMAHRIRADCLREGIYKRGSLNVHAAKLVELSQASNWFSSHLQIAMQMSCCQTNNCTPGFRINVDFSSFHCRNQACKDTSITSLLATVRL